ncbi:hypothetical protein BH11PLA2_BH11PLA2_03620 [soil metagenome]
MIRVLSLAVVLLSVALPLQAQSLDRKKLDTIDALAAESIAKGGCPGAVIVVLHKDEVVYRKAFGQRSLEPAKEPMTVDTIFDMASVTKPVATGTSIHLLIQQGKLSPSDLVSKHWPEFAANGKDKVTVEHCLLHISGLTADNSANDYKGGHDIAMKNIEKLKLEVPAGTRFKYSDVGFIVLGELVKRISGMSVDQFAAKNVFEPLKMTDSGYNPPKEKLSRIAPTGLRNKEIIRGSVHDPRAFEMAGIAGHAGLFSTADDMVKYCNMMLRNGKVIESSASGMSVATLLKPESLRLFTTPHDVPPKGQRSLGWDVATSYSGQRGDRFATGFGHTGFTGTSLWIDPVTQTAIIILSNRVHPNDKGNVSELRRKVAGVVAEAVGVKPRPKAPVMAGIDVLARDGFKELQGKKIGLVTNHTGRTIDGTSTIDILSKVPGVTLVALFSPEHGIRGEKDEKVGDSKDEITGLPVYSLYGDRRKPTKETLKGIDTLVYDIQDIGCRFYTFSSTLGLVLEAGKENDVAVVVLDRPNPIGGSIVEGPLRDDGPAIFVAFHNVPLRHGLTVGEMAKMFNVERSTNAKLTVIPCENWSRGDTWDKTGLPWRNPSPNMRHLSAAMLYPGVGLIEFTNVSVGRGTERPFEWIGAPFIDGRKLATELNNMGLPGVRFIPCSRTPTSSTNKDKECGGVDILIDDWNAVRSVTVGFGIMTALQKLYAKEWNVKKLDTLLKSKAVHDAILAGTPLANLDAMVQPQLDEYKKRREKFLMYE